MAINLGLTETVSIGLFVIGMVATWPDVPWTPLLIVLIVVTVTLPVLAYPFTRTFWVALERHFHRWED